MSPLLNDKPERLNAAAFPLIARNISCGQIAIRFGLQGPSSVLASGSIASIQAVMRACHFIRSKKSTVALAGGFEVLSKISLYIARRLYGDAMSTEKPQFFGTRHGYITPSEGACMLVLESLEHAQRRGAKVYAEVVNWDTGRFGKRNSSVALANSWSSLTEAIGGPDTLRVICAASGGSNRQHELIERNALSAFHSSYSQDTQVCAVRSFTGEGEAWSSAFQVAAAAHLVNGGVVPTTCSVADDAPAQLASNLLGRKIAPGSAIVSGLDAVGAWGNLCLKNIEA
jgi:3-oxoacyl-[acyl-carrier-protein] synthase II/nodulation protein E